MSGDEPEPEPVEDVVHHHIRRRGAPEPIDLMSEPVPALLAIEAGLLRLHAAIKDALVARHTAEPMAVMDPYRRAAGGRGKAPARFYARDEAMTLGPAAAYVGLPVRVLKRMAERGLVKFEVLTVGIRPRRRFRRSVLDRLLQERGGVAA